MCVHSLALPRNEKFWLGLDRLSLNVWVYIDLFAGCPLLVKNNLFWDVLIYLQLF